MTEEDNEPTGNLLLNQLALMEHSISDLIKRVNIADSILYRTRAMGVAVVAVILLILGTCAYQVQSTANAAKDRCNAGNVLRTGERTLWGNVINGSTAPVLPPNPTAEQVVEYQRQVRVIEQFKSDLKTYFAPLKC